MASTSTSPPPTTVAAGSPGGSPPTKREGVNRAVTASNRLAATIVQVLASAGLPTAGVHDGGSLAGERIVGRLVDAAPGAAAKHRLYATLEGCGPLRLVGLRHKAHASGNHEEPHNAHRPALGVLLGLAIPDAGPFTVHSEICRFCSHRPYPKQARGQGDARGLRARLKRIGTRIQ